jgi:dTDP-4-amino-4,6-dideoxygalactose transaminase
MAHSTADGLRVRFVEPDFTGEEAALLAEALAAGRLAGGNAMTRRCEAWLEDAVGGRALLTPSCTDALEMAALLADLRPGDEVIMPSFTFSSTANAFVLRGAVPVFVDVRPDTLNLDERLVEEAVGPRTRAIVVVHYAGVACEMDAIMDIADRRGLLVVEDAAHALGAAYRGRPLGGVGHMSAFSFHETKNLQAGEGGAFVTRIPALFERAEIVREKGTNRSAFFRGEIDKYTWVDIGSSFLANELTAACLLAQMRGAEDLAAGRHAAWTRYHEALAPLEARGMLRRPVVPAHCAHSAHLYYVLLPTPDRCAAFMAGMRDQGIQVTRHYVPLHSAEAGRRYCRAVGDLPVTCSVSDRLVRLPLWARIGDRVDAVVDAVRRAVS